MNSQQCEEYDQSNPSYYLVEAHQPNPTWPQIPRVELSNRRGVDMRQRIFYEETRSSMLDPMSNGAPKNVSNGAPKNVSNGAPKNVSNGAPKNVSNGAPKNMSNGVPKKAPERVQKRKYGGASSSSHEVDHEVEEDLDIIKKLDLFEIQIKNLQRVAGTLWNRLSAEERERQKQKHAILRLRDAMANDHDEFRKGVETLVKHCMDTRKKLKTHNKILDDFQGLVEAYMGGKMEHYLNERCLMKFNEMADKILSDTEMTPEKIGDIARSLMLDTADDYVPSPATSETEEPMLVWKIEDVTALFTR